MSKQGSRRRARSWDQKRFIENDAAGDLDRLALFEEFEKDILPQLKADLRRGLSASEIYAKYASMAAARQVSIALTDPQSSVAQAAAKDILDRDQGKAKEKVEITGKLQKMSDDDLDALLMSKLATKPDETKDNPKKH